MKISLKSELPSLLCIAAMAIALAFAWPASPDRIPVHWNLHGEADGYGSRFEGLALLPIGAVLIYLVLRFLPLADPRRSNYADFQTAYDVIRHGTVAFMAVIQGLTIAVVLGAEIDMALAVSTLVGIFFVAIGLLLDHAQIVLSDAC